MKRALLLLVLLACTPKADPASDPAWLVKAKQTGGSLVDDAVKTRATATRVDAEDRKAIDGFLDRASASTATPDGIRLAALLIANGETVGKGADAPALERAGGLAVLADLVFRACKAKPNDVGVVRALDAIPLSDEQKRNSLRSVGKSCGAKPKDPIGP